MVKVLLAGESWVSATIDHKGYDPFAHTQVEIGCERLLAALAAEGVEVTHLRSHDVAEKFPQTLEELAAYDVVLLSDVGSNTLLLHPDTFTRGRPAPNRLKLLREWVRGGGGLMMAGGYLSFQGFEGKANYHRTPIEEILPVDIDPFDDRVETPEGVRAQVVQSGHPVVAGLDREWPILLGYQHTTLKPDAELLATVEGDVMLAARQFGEGRTLAFTSDVSPHWAPEEFMSWEGYRKLFAQALTWLAGREI
ncbi:MULTISPECIES: glutamine amidotransferase [Amycolatopsis]|uniref:Cytoplasmic protein n=1 Tax=Amycolatopsis dendrobii TaxID=2760662 RepID=A0A7W3W6Y2_9PSEU|nr:MULTISPECIES: glutamine amidotransferase [Amycolatopsis]MBB1159880.1 cytoplasmic protein [Amycolatopsis dendrobii]UKD59070.1 glutamine amidotransferase [Amycolatopsis sp. FU40]